MKVDAITLGMLADQSGQVFVPFMLGERDDHADVLWAVLGFDLFFGQILRQVEHFIHRRPIQLPAG